MNTPTNEIPSLKSSTSKPSPSNANPGDLARQLYPIIAQQPFFKGLSPGQLRVLADSATRAEFKPDESIFREGERANCFYIILEGKVVLESEVKEHKAVTVQTLGPGDNLGWSWLFPPYYLHFSARAMEPVKAILFYGTRLQQQCEDDHELGYQLMKRSAETLIQNLHATQLRLMESVDVANLPR